MIIRQVQECDRIPLKGLLADCYDNGMVSKPLNDVDMFDKWLMTPNQYTFVGFFDGKLVATHTVIIEHKLIHDYSKVAHLEDLAVHKEYRNRGLGRRMFEYTIEFCKQQGVYKMLHTCNENLVGYYEKIADMYVHEISMRRDFN